MKLSSIIILLCVISAPVLLADTDKLTDEQISQELTNRRISIENYYKRQILEVKLRSAEELRQLEVIDSLSYKSLEAHTLAAEQVMGIEKQDHWAEPDNLIKKWAIDRPNYVVGFSRQGRSRRARRSSIATFGIAVEKPYINGYEKTITKNFSKRFVEAQGMINERKSDIITKRDVAIMTLDIQMQRAIAFSYEAFKKQLTETPLSETEKKSPKNIVTGILYSNDNPAALLNGNIVHVGDELDNDITIADITKDIVEFERRCDSWQQAVGEEPSKYW